MDKVAQYKKLVRQVIEEVAAFFRPGEPVEPQIILDDERGHYLLFSVGWEGKNWHYASIVHIDVRPDGKVWLQHDGTDLVLADELVRKGIPKQDIVLGFQSPVMRQYIEDFAVA